RNSEYQALLPIRGKILNVHKASIADMLKNAECAAIIQVLGAGSGRTFDLDSARYGKVILMADADADGSHIRCLLLTLLYRYMRPLLESGRVFAAVPPLHRIEVVGTKEPIYTYTDPEMRRKIAELERKGKRIKQPIQRYKGLGEMDARQLAETTLDPGRRTLRRISLGDAESAEQFFELLMGNDVAPRRQFIVDSSSVVDRERIDT
ncbi:MAG: gyrase subunit, partial [Frankiales bacterium]|nr:gyrase subunit [Frankiales bacterium]